MAYRAPLPAQTVSEKPPQRAGSGLPLVSGAGSGLPLVSGAGSGLPLVSGAGTGCHRRRSIDTAAGRSRDGLAPRQTRHAGDAAVSV